MGIFCITRTKFLDREFDVERLTMFAEMLREWSGMCTAGSGVWQCEAKVYACPRGELKQIQLELSALPAVAAIDGSDEDEFKIIGKPTALGYPIDLDVWKFVLNDAMVRRGCVILRLTFEGQFLSSSGGEGHGRSTFVLCGEPVENGLVVKAIWQVGGDESFGLVYRSVGWHSEQLLLKAFDLYLLNWEAQRHDAAGYALEAFGTEAKNLFMTSRHESRAMMLVRHWTELPDDWGPGAFVRRAGVSLFISFACVAAAFFIYRAGFSTALIFLLVGMYFLYSSCRIVVKKLGRIRAYHTRMRAGLGKLYSGPITYKEIDLSGDASPSLRKCSIDIEDLGGVHLCDICISTAKGVLDGNRVYRLGNSTMAIGLLRKTENLLFFPAKPVLLCKTWFEDGRRHYTQNTPRYRKRSLMHVTGRCLPDGGGPAEVLELQERHVEKLIASGAVVRRVEQTGGEVLEGMEKEHEESREGWNRSPYSWGDAVHDAFKVCRREYLVD